MILGSETLLSVPFKSHYPVYLKIQKPTARWVQLAYNPES